jgi:uncharacterized protein
MKNNPYVKNLKTAVFDIETMGLFPTRDMLVLGGIYSVNDEKMFQFFCENPLQEPEVIEKIITALAGYDAIITYNGDSFDWPFLRRRAEINGVPYNPAPLYSIDLFRWLKMYWPQAKNMPSLRQKAVEEALGLADHRDDEINGNECVMLYKQYMQTKDPYARETLLLHNHDDVLQLDKISNSLHFLPFHKIASEQGFLIKEDRSRIKIEKVFLTENILTVSAATHKGLLPISIYDEGYHLEYDSDSGKIDLAVVCRREDGYLFADLRELPVSVQDFSGLPGFHNEFLLMEENRSILYREINSLAGLILKSIFKEGASL